MITRYFDNETSGLLKPSLSDISLQPYVWQFFSIDDNDDELEIFIKPPIAIPPECIPKSVARDKIKKAAVAKEITQKISNCPSFGDVADRIKDNIESCDELFAHHAAFDKQMIDVEMQRVGKKVDWPRVRCSIEETEYLKGYRLNLTALHEFLFGEGFDSAHDARFDVLALRRCVHALKEREMI